jgi:hypothetical protein
MGTGVAEDRNIASRKIPIDGPVTLAHATIVDRQRVHPLLRTGCISGTSIVASPGARGSNLTGRSV